MGIEVMPGAQALIAKADPRVSGGVTGVPNLQAMLNGNIDVQYGVQLPGTLIQKFLMETTILDRVMAISNVTRRERAAIFGSFDSADFSAGTYGDFITGGDPPGISVTRSFGTLVKKSYGALASITDVDAIASGQAGMPTQYGDMSVSNDRELLLALTLRKTMTALEYSVVKGNESSRNTQFNGIETALTYDATNRPFVMDLNGATGQLYSSLNQLVLQQATYGVTPTELWMHPVMKQQLVNDYLATTGVTLYVNSDAGTVTPGKQMNSIVTAVGELPIFTSRHFTLAGSGQNLSGDVFVIANSINGVPLLGMEWMVPPTAIEPLARVPGFYTSQVMGTWCHGVFLERSNWWAQGRIRNVGINFFNRTLAPFKP